MYQIGLKLWSVNTDHYLHEAERLYADGVFSYIELYIVPGSLEHLPAWKKLNIPYIMHNAHFMQHFNLAKRECEASNRKIYEETKRFADGLNASHIIFHGGIDGNIEETARQLTAFGEPRALIENKPFRALPNRMGGDRCRGYNIAELKTVMDASGCGFCLDFGHAVCAANSQKRDPYEYIREMTSLHPTMFHLTDVTDIHSEYDSHPHLGEGQLSLGRTAAMLRDGIRVTVETNKNSTSSLADFVNDSKTLRFYDLHCDSATLSDAREVFNLSSDPVVRKNSFCQDLISWENHLAWMKKKLQSPNCHFYLVKNHNGQLAGQVRFEFVENGKYEVSLSITSEYRGRHFSTCILVCAIQALQQTVGHAAELTARIKKDNISSLKCFQSAGFRPYKTTQEETGLIYEL